MGLDLDPAAGGILAKSVNYAATLEQVQFIAEHGRWRMLESMGTAMARLLLSPPAPGEGRAQVEHVVVLLSKPVVFEGRAVPSVELRRARAWCDLMTVPASDRGVRIEVLNESIESGAYRVHLEPGADWTAPAGMRWTLISGGAVAAGKEVTSGLLPDLKPQKLSWRWGPAGACLLVVGESRLAKAQSA